MKNIVILGSTGSIGVNTLKVVESMPESYNVIGLSSHSNISLLARQIKRFKPLYACIADPAKLSTLKKKTNHKRPKLLCGSEGLCELSSLKKADIVVIAISGASAIHPLMTAVESSKRICLANKEAIVIAGDIIMKKAKSKGAAIIPVDSEHSAIFQCINTEEQEAIRRIYLTGSGGPLLNVPRSKLRDISVKRVLKHPRWKMGKKITIDSATLMNKGLEMIEAKNLFGIEMDMIEVLVHPQAVVHSMVEFIDGSVIAQLGVTDMKLPIQYALSYPKRMPSDFGRLDFSEIRTLDFLKPDIKKYPCLAIAMACAKLAGTYPAVLNASDEVAVEAFLQNRIRFTDIPRIIEKVLKKHKNIQGPRLSDILQADSWAREETVYLC
jgi:1-deoxy-D-xylulose-5-phosphate reductoisomerase